MLEIPVRAIPSQILSVQLAGQPCRLKIYQQASGLYVDLYVNDALIIGGVICRNANRLVRSAYLGFVGDLAFFDTRGSEDPYYDGLGARWVLNYLEAGE